MNRNNPPRYATVASLEQPSPQQVIIRPPIRAAYDTQKEFDYAVRLAVSHAQQNNIPYIDNYDY
jgi:hypothetical protein